MKDNNALYKDIIINLHLTDSLEGGFVFINISSRVLQYGENMKEREGYAINLKVDNIKNDLYHVASNAGIGDLGLLNSYLYSNINKIYKYLTMILVLAITNEKNRSNHDKTKFLILTYQNNKCITPLNDWDYLKYFIAFFSISFFFDIAGYLSTTNGLKKEKILLET